jgi:hypothetical protein
VDANSLNNKISILTVEKLYSRRLILQFMSINQILCHATPALAAAPIMDMNEPQVIRFVCFFLLHYLLLVCKIKMFNPMHCDMICECDLLFLCEAFRTLKLANGVRVQGNKMFLILS